MSDLRGEVGGEISREGCRRRCGVGGDDLKHTQSEQRQEEVKSVICGVESETRERKGKKEEES